MATYTRRLWLASGGETLLSARLVAQAAFTLDASNYWTVTVYHRRAATGAFAALANGETVGTYSLATRSLVADTPVTIYESEQGLALGDGDSLVAVVTSTGSPAQLDNPVISLDIQRNTR